MLFIDPQRVLDGAGEEEQERNRHDPEKIVGIGAIAGALGFSAVGMAGVANATPTPPAALAVIQHAQLAGWGGPGFGGPGWHGPGFGGPGLGWGGAGWGGRPLPPPCPLGLCI
jgi:hypothetical protein